MIWSFLLPGCGPDGSATVPTEPTEPTEPTTPTPTPTPQPDPERCVASLVADGPPLPVEGDTVELQLDCTTTDRSAWTPSLLTAPDGAVLDPVTWRISWPTTLDDAGRHSFFVDVNRAGHQSGAAQLTVDVSDAGPGVAGNAPPDPATYFVELGLPVLQCFPEGALSEVYTVADCWSAGVEYPAATIKIRGAASASYPKPSYTLEFDPEQLDGDPIGMRDKDHLVLISPFDDNAYVRQKLVYDVWEDLADVWGVDRLTPDTEFVVVYLGGQWVGLYVATDHVDDEFVEEEGLSPASAVHKSVSHDANFRRTSSSGAPKTDLTLGWEQKEGSADDLDDLAALTAFVSDSDPASFAAAAPDWIRVDEFMDWYLLVAYSAAQDSAGKNAYLVTGSPLEFRYVPWDFNHAWGQSWTTSRVPVQTFDWFRSQNAIFERFHDDPASSAALWARYDAAAAPGGPLHPDSLEARLDGYYALIDAEARRDWAAWEDDYRAYSRWSSRADFTTYDEERDYVYGWVAGRAAVMAANRP